MDQDATWCGGRPRSKRHCVRWGPSSRCPKKWAEPPNFRPMSCGQTTGWIKMPLGMELSLGPCHIVLDGDPAPPPQKRRHTPTFGPCLIVYCGQTAGWIKMPLGMDVGLSPGHIVLDRDPAPRNFWPMSVVAKRLDGSRCHLVWRYASAQATLCWTGNQLPLKGAHFYCG